MGCDFCEELVQEIEKRTIKIHSLTNKTTNYESLHFRLSNHAITLREPLRSPPFSASGTKLFLSSERLFFSILLNVNVI
jgi:hypothetical protein